MVFKHLTNNIIITKKIAIYCQLNYLQLHDNQIPRRLLNLHEKKSI